MEVIVCGSFGKFVSVTLAAVVIAMFALSSDDKWCSRVDKAFDESALGSFLNESKAGYGRYATGLPGQAASVLADSGKNGENGENSGTEQDIGQTADTTPTHRAADRDYEETDKISDGIRVEGVYACGRLTGIYEQTEGVLVVNTTEVTDEDGKKSIRQIKGCSAVIISYLSMGALWQTRRSFLKQ